jgi:hypothetical protein
MLFFFFFLVKKLSSSGRGLPRFLVKKLSSSGRGLPRVRYPSPPDVGGCRGGRKTWWRW